MQSPTTALSTQISQRAEIVKALLLATNAQKFVDGLAEASGRHPYDVWFDNFENPLKRINCGLEWKSISLSDVALAIAGLHLLEALVRANQPPGDAGGSLEVIRANKLKAVA